jgi:IS30 family transposase
MKVYEQMSLEERKELYLMYKNGAGIKAIAMALSRSASTISRELKRNTVDKRVGYLPDEAHREASERKEKH